MTNETKHCTHCDKHLSKDNFQVCKSRKDNLQAYCKECVSHKNKTEKAVLTRIYRGQKLAEKTSPFKKVAYTKDKLTHWLYKNGFQLMYNQYKASGYNSDLIPSVDRIDASKGYNLENIQLVPWIFNRLKMSVDAFEKNNMSGIRCTGKIKKVYRVVHQQQGEIITRRFTCLKEALDWKTKKIEALKSILADHDVVVIGDN